MCCSCWCWNDQSRCHCECSRPTGAADVWRCCFRHPYLQQQQSHRPLRQARQGDRCSPPERGPICCCWHCCCRYRPDSDRTAWPGLGWTGCRRPPDDLEPGGWRWPSSTTPWGEGPRWRPIQNRRRTFILCLCFFLVCIFAMRSLPAMQCADTRQPPTSINNNGCQSRVPDGIGAGKSFSLSRYSIQFSMRSALWVRWLGRATKLVAEREVFQRSKRCRV